jgi:hypothetical protein
VKDPQNLLGMELPSVEEKYEELIRLHYLKGKPELEGGLPRRAFDSFMLRVFGLVFDLGRSAQDIESEYLRLTSNFERVGKVAKRLRFLGPFIRLPLRLIMRTCGNIAARQYVHNLTRNGDFPKTAMNYARLLDLYNIDAEICMVEDDEVVMKIHKCPLGYESVDEVKLCMASYKIDRQYVRAQGARILVEELIPEGAPACLCHLVPAGRKVPEEWRRYPRFTF